MTNLQVVQLMNTPKKREYVVKPTEQADLSRIPQNWHLPLLVSIEYLSYDHKRPDGSIIKSKKENDLTIKDARGNALYHGTVVKSGHPYDAEDSGDYDYEAEAIIGTFSDPLSSLNEDEIDTVVKLLFNNLVSTIIETTDHDCECCGWFTNSTVIMSHNNIDCDDITYDYDGHMGRSYTPSLMDLISFALTGDANQSHPYDDY